MTHPSHLGALGHAFLASSTLHTAFHRVQRFLHMVHGRLLAKIDEWPGHMRLSWDLLAYYPYPHQFAESRLAGALTLARMNFGGELRPIRVALTRERPDSASPWEEFFGCPIRFGSKKDSITFAESDMRRLLSTANRELVILHEDLMERQLHSLDRLGLVHRARSMLVEELPTGRITEAQLAARLNMSQRTLQRRLRESGKDLSQLAGRGPQGPGAALSGKTGLPDHGDRLPIGLLRLERFLTRLPELVRQITQHDEARPEEVEASC